jgi:uncharacterized membrane protein YphA (DoxX/SURF4 family)
MNGVDMNCPLPVKEAKGASTKIQSLLAIGCRYVVGGIFVMAGISKIATPRDFESQVLLHSCLPSLIAKLLPTDNLQLSFSLSRGLIALLPWLELTCGLCLVFKKAVRESALIASLLLSLFIAHSFAYRSEDCQCFFFPISEPVRFWWWHTLRDILLLSCSVYLICRNTSQDEKVEQAG